MQAVRAEAICIHVCYHIRNTFRGNEATMSKPNVFVTRLIPAKGLDTVQEFCNVDLWQGELPPTREELLKYVQGVDGLLCLLTDKIDSEVMDAAGPQLKVISNH